VSGGVPTAEFASLVYGDGGVALDDPAEAFHEASRLYPDVAPGRLAALLELGRSPELQQTVARSSRTHEHRAGVELPPAGLGRARLRRVLAARRSRAPAGAAELPRRALGAMLASGYRATGGRRPVPSAGALYPLELYVAALAVEGVPPALYHYHPFAHRLEALAAVSRAQLAAAFVAPELAAHAAAVVVVTGMFWRSRVKYGLRGYRFALLEAGHVMQNLVLAASAAGVPALPVGGFYDRRLDDVVGCDGLDEASLYALVLGGGP
jgi:SagB-type dehydrogenase family enzyme